MGAKSRNKGANGERELARILREHLGDSVIRNWQGQAASGGHDLSGLPFAIEVKRYAFVTDFLKRKWWEQAVTQADDEEPALAYRADRQEWRFVVPARNFNSYMTGLGDVDYEWTVEFGLEAFCQLCRESANGI